MIPIGFWFILFHVQPPSSRGTRILEPAHNNLKGKLFPVKRRLFPSSVGLQNYKQFPLGKPFTKS